LFTRLLHHPASERIGPSQQVTGPADTESVRLSVCLLFPYSICTLKAAFDDVFILYIITIIIIIIIISSKSC